MSGQRQRKGKLTIDDVQCYYRLLFSAVIGITAMNKANVGTVKFETASKNMQHFLLQKEIVKLFPNNWKT